MHLYQWECHCEWDVLAWVVAVVVVVIVAFVSHRWYMRCHILWNVFIYFEHFACFPWETNTQWSFTCYNRTFNVVMCKVFGMKKGKTKPERKKIQRRFYLSVFEFGGLFFRHQDFCYVFHHMSNNWDARLFQLDKSNENVTLLSVTPSNVISSPISKGPSILNSIKETENKRSLHYINA